MWKGILLSMAFGCFTLAPAMAGVQEREIAPRATDNQIDKWNSNHIVCFDPAVTPRNLLFVFLPGSHLNAGDYQLITRVAAEAGLHAISLNYPNSWTVNFDLCDNTNDANCYEACRLEIIDGTDRTPRVDVNRPNSIENRLIKLLLYLDKNFPQEGWGQYFRGGDSLVWEKMIVGGHSQGAGHTGVIAHYHRLERALFLAGGEDGSATTGLAPWISANNATPAAGYYGFTHAEDNLFGRQQVWNIWGMFAFGTLVTVDNTPAPFQGSHTLVTRLKVSDAHQSVAVDSKTPKVNNEPAYAEVWRYMMVGGKISTGVAQEAGTLPASFWLAQNHPNPFNPATTIRFAVPSEQFVTLKVYDNLGKLVATLVDGAVAAGTHSVEFEAAGLASGLYWYRLETAQGLLQKAMQLVK
ncbi:MAG: T9SS type A sorting domain-containing protein [candidate division KSB1 bacterium]|nr:T9SS type A sorting domain-containing protein [candidate division KSB1 bacterium]MDZ7275816.1 T9SS type A sorting domain-containing protein [candidate division KSB1 bacterium]MDZ7287567.1 T9SS type A sorting domain-containing protein [candidate division KSB1 bacterium]MDZ7308029.1 T9SS type A sorting domain-containing protein [candidate division KSB1 bacterium]MDZ7350545.1 T9SS type A sorting domain-containing protein [candidate division KSB1 bacterium]